MRRAVQAAAAQPQAKTIDAPLPEMFYNAAA